MDFDGDGVRDLVVGEFGDGKFPDNQLQVRIEELRKQLQPFNPPRPKMHGWVWLYLRKGASRR